MHRSKSGDVLSPMQFVCHADGEEWWRHVKRVKEVSVEEAKGGVGVFLVKQGEGQQAGFWHALVGGVIVRGYSGPGPSGDGPACRHTFWNPGED